MADALLYVDHLLMCMQMNNDCYFCKNFVFCFLYESTYRYYSDSYDSYDQFVFAHVSIFKLAFWQV